MSDDELHDQAQTALTDLNCTHPDAGITGLRALFKRIGADSPDAEVIKRAIDRLEEIAHEITQVENLLSEAISVSARSRREHPPKWRGAMLDYQKPMVSDDDERRPLLTESELYDACLHDAATIVVAFAYGCEFEDCRLTDDGYKWPTSISRIEIKYPEDWRWEEVFLAVAAIHEAGAMAVAKRHGRGPHRINENRTPELLNDPVVWKTVEALAQFIEDNYEGDGCYGASGTDCHEPGEEFERAQADQGHGPHPQLRLGPLPSSVVNALDLFCGAGGATRGLQQAGFHVVGADLHRQPNYCGDAFIQADAIEYLETADLTISTSSGRARRASGSPPCGTRRERRRTRI